MVDKPVLKKKDFESDQAVRWCPGCGDYAILAQTQKVFPEITTDKEKVVFVENDDLEEAVKFWTVTITKKAGKLFKLVFLPSCFFKFFYAFFS